MSSLPRMHSLQPKNISFRLIQVVEILSEILSADCCDFFIECELRYNLKDFLSPSGARSHESQATNRTRLSEMKNR